MSGTTDSKTRRTVLKTVGAAVGVATLTGAATAEVSTSDVTSGDCVVADGPDGFAAVYAECGGTAPVGRVDNGRTGTVRELCDTIGTDRWAYVVWDDASPDGWVPEEHLSACVSPH